MEIQILHWFETLHNPITNPIFYVITTLGNAGWFWIVLAVLMLTVLPKKYKKAGLTMAIALILSLIFCNGDVYKRQAFQQLMLQVLNME